MKKNNIFTVNRRLFINKLTRIPIRSGKCSTGRQELRLPRTKRVFFALSTLVLSVIFGAVLLAPSNDVLGSGSIVIEPPVLKNQPPVAEGTGVQTPPEKRTWGENNTLFHEFDLKGKWKENDTDVDARLEVFAGERPFETVLHPCYFIVLHPDGSKSIELYWVEVNRYGDGGISCEGYDQKWMYHLEMETSDDGKTVRWVLKPISFMHAPHPAVSEPPLEPEPAPTGDASKPAKITEIKKEKGK